MSDEELEEIYKRTPRAEVPDGYRLDDVARAYILRFIEWRIRDSKILDESHPLYWHRAGYRDALINTFLALEAD